MKVVLLAGGFGTRIAEESSVKPKPMVEIGNMPILWHIMKTYSHYGFNEFVVCAGYKQHMIKKFFSDYFLHTSDITFDFTQDKETMIVHKKEAEPWKVTIVDTGINTMTGGRVKRIQKYIDEDDFLLTYGDGVSDIKIDELVEFHKKNNKLVTMSAYNAGQRFGVLDIDPKGLVREFREKNQVDGDLINIGYMVCKREFFDYIDADSTVLEKKTLETVAKEGELIAYRHTGFWQCMDTLRDKQKLEAMWSENKAPWKVW